MSAAVGRGHRRGALRGIVALAIVAAGVVALVAARPHLARWRREQALPRGERPTILLLTLDSTRADRLGFSGNERVKTPRLDALARHGAVFERAYVPSPWCLPSHASILTGRTPLHHGVWDDVGYALKTEVPTLAERFRGAGYRTAAFVSYSVLDRSSGIDRGFEAFHDDLGSSGKMPAGRPETASAAETVYRVQDWLASAPEGPLFLWVHFADARAPYAPPDPFAKEYLDRPYDGEIAFMDAESGKLVDALRRARPDTLVALIADHGESLGDHGEDTHGYFVYSSTTRVPLVLSMPGRVPEGLRVAAVVRSVDLMPTLLDITGLPNPDGLDGASLVPLLVGRTTAGPGPAPIQNLGPHLRYGLSPVYALRSGPYLYVHAPQPELYDAEQDAGETDDAVARLSRVASALDRELEPYRKGGPAVSGIDPKDALEIYRRYRAAQAMDGRGEWARAIVVYRSVVADSPGFTLARHKLSDDLMRTRQNVEAEVLLRDLVGRGQGNEATYLNLGLLRYKLGKTGEALEWLEKGTQAFPRSPALRHRKGRLLLRLKRPEEAMRELQEAVSLEPRFLDAHLALGEAFEALGRGDDARKSYRRVAEIGPLSDEAKQATTALDRLQASRPPRYNRGSEKGAPR
jgi:choline-sulfatase